MLVNKSLEWTGTQYIRRYLWLYNFKSIFVTKMTNFFHVFVLFVVLIMDSKVYGATIGRYWILKFMNVNKAKNWYPMLAYKCNCHSWYDYRCGEDIKHHNKNLYHDVLNNLQRNQHYKITHTWAEETYN